MSTTSKVTHVIDFSGDVDAQLVYASGDNEDSPAASLMVTLVGEMEFIPPNGTPTGITIVPTITGDFTITLKGASGDVGIELHPSNPTTLALGDSFTSLFLEVEPEVVDEVSVRIVWS